MFQKTAGFTLTELIVVIAILSILSTIGFVQYGGYQATSRDSARQSDISALQIGLKATDRSSGAYPIPAMSGSLSYSGLIVAIGGKMNNDVALESIDTIGLDPLTKNGYYYSISGYRNHYLLGATLEVQAAQPKGYIVTDYRASIVDTLPTIGFATGSSGDIADLRSTFLFDGSSKNLPYSIDMDSPQVGTPVHGAISYEDILSESGIITLPKKRLHDSCSDVALDRAYIGTGVYYISDGNGNETQIICDISNITQ